MRRLRLDLDIGRRDRLEAAIDQALALPNIYMAGDLVQVEEGTPLAALQSSLAAKGRGVLVTPLESKVNAVEWTGTLWRGAADPRTEGKALEE